MVGLVDTSRTTMAVSRHSHYQYHDVASSLRRRTRRCTFTYVAPAAYESEWIACVSICGCQSDLWRKERKDNDEGACEWPPTWSIHCTRCATTMPVAACVFISVTFCRCQSCPDGVPRPMYMQMSVPAPRYNSLCHVLSVPGDAVLGPTAWS